MVATNSFFNEHAIFRLHLTNIAGLGAVRLIQSLLPSIVLQDKCLLEQVYIPENKDIVDITLFDSRTKVSVYKRYLPNSVSRFLECTVFGGRFNGDSPLLVLGDIPLRCRAPQIVFLQNKLLLDDFTYVDKRDYLKYWILQSLFKRNLKYVDSFIVQTVGMKDQLIRLYPGFKERVHVIAQPVPEWLIESGLQRPVSNYDKNQGLKLFYPAAFYPHKNHKLLDNIDNPEVWSIDSLTLTISDESNSLSKAKWIRCKGVLTPEAVLNEYRAANALLFLSFTESYGFPLVEAMWIGLPIICPDLGYARNLCGDQAIYFSPRSVSSLHLAVNELNHRLRSGWWPNWSEQLTGVPEDWESVASSMIEVALIKR